MSHKRVVKPPDERRRELIDAARALFIEQGYEQTAMSDIAKRAGVAQGTFYIYFPSKQDVLAAIMRELLEELCGIIQGLTERSDLTALGVLKQMMADCIARIWQEPRLVGAIYLQANYSLPARLLGEYTPLLLPTITSLIERGVREGTLRVTNPRLAADLLWTVGYRFFETAAQQHMTTADADSTGQERPSMTELQNAFWEFVFQGLGATQPG